MTHKLKFNVISAAVIASLTASLGYSSIVMAQQETSAQETQNLQNEDIEVIEVSGFRSSLQKSINAKRFAKGVVDSIHAEDVGKSTDQNIADALSRVTGVTVQETDGEGTKISVRGAGSALNQISINGVALTSGLSGDGSNASADQSVDLSSFSSDILASIDVQKTSAADQDEGSLGANIVLRTVRPLSLKNPRRSLELQGRYNDYSGEYNRKIAGTFSDKFLDETLGVIFTISDETQNTRVDQFSVDWDDEVFTAAPGRARDSKTGEVIDTEVEFITPASGEYRLSTNSRDRVTATAGIQFIPSESTEVQIDLNYSKQDVDLSNHRFNLQLGLTDPNLDTDPQQDWWYINQETHTLEKRLMRRSRGRVYRQIDGSEVENKIASINIKQVITDTLFADLTLGYSRTESNSKPNASLLLNPAANTADTPLVSDNPNVPSLEPSGIDCLGGSCRLVVAEGLAPFRPGEGNPATVIAPNLSNPLDTFLFRVANINQDIEQNTDTNKSVFLNFDWELDDFFGITTVEFGGKYTNRVKDVSAVRNLINNGNVLLDENGEEFSVGGLTDIRLADVLTGNGFPVDNFMDSVISDDAPFLNGWGDIDPFKALEIVNPSSGAEGKDVRTRSDPSGSRRIEQSVNAFYGKLNFDYFDGFVTGNIGIRHVKTSTDAQAFSSVRYLGNANFYDPIDLIYDRQLANLNLPPCPLNTSDNSPAYPGGDQNQYPTNLPAAGTCHDPQLLYNFRRNQLVNGQVPANLQTPENQILQVTYDANGNVVSIDQNSANTNGRQGRFPNNQNTIKAWADRSTVTNYINPATGEELGFDAQQRNVLNSDSASNDLWLPSLNLNFALDEDLIGRFAVSKTMARPTFDDTRPSGRIVEDQFRTFGSGSINNVALKPLESKNLDISLEWYFDKSGLASIALFRKDMTNFTESIAETFLWRDLRTNYDLEGVNSLNDILITPEAVIDPATGDQARDEFTGLGLWTQTPLNTPDGGLQCMPDRQVHSHLSNPWTFNCHTLILDVRRNGKGAVTQGVELNYTQNYDFLPGMFSGLGLSMNYTFADSESEEEVSETTGLSVKPLPQPFTPRHSANATVFWEKDDVMLRLAARYNSTQLINRNTAAGFGASWLEATTRLDFSSTYKYNKHIQFSFQALNLTDEINRSFLTSTGFEFNGERLDEGNAMTNSVPRSRVLSESRTGRQFRFGVRATF